jgi:serine/threonine-protein kinase
VSFGNVEVVNYAIMTSLSVLKPICFAVVLACAVACAPSHHDDSGGRAAPAATKAATPEPGEEMTA